MQLTKPVDYPLRAMIRLAFIHGGNYVDIYEISKTRNVTENLILKIIPQLEQGDLSEPHAARMGHLIESSATFD